MDKKDNKEKSYYNLAIQMSILLFILAFVEPENEIVNAIVKLTTYTLLLVVFIIHLVAEKRRNILIATSIIAFCWNIFLLTTPIIATTKFTIDIIYIKWYNVGLMVIAGIFFYLGQWIKTGKSYWTEPINLENQKLLFLLIGASIFIQFIMRI